MSLELCPNCNGQKTVSRPPWISGDQETWDTADSSVYPCPTCDANGYITIETKGKWAIRMKTKICTKSTCPARGKPQPVSEFNRKSDTKDRLNCWCKVCSREARRNAEGRSFEMIYRRMNARAIARKAKEQ